MRGLIDSYPTKDEILDKPHLHKRNVIRAFWDWKKTIWYPARHSDSATKFDALSQLAQNLAQHYDKPVNVTFSPELPSCMYVPATNTIHINESLSILSTLHELAHHLYGASEKKACRWSVWLFRKVFKRSYEQLEWQGHMLIKKE